MSKQDVTAGKENQNNINIVCDVCGEPHTIHFDNVVRLTRIGMLQEILALPTYRPGGDNPYTYINIDDIMEVNQDLQELSDD
jgi:hypothetical protein